MDDGGKAVHGDYHHLSANCKKRKCNDKKNEPSAKTNLPKEKGNVRKVARREATNRQSSKRSNKHGEGGGKGEREGRGWSTNLKIGNILGRVGGAGWRSRFIYSKVIQDWCGRGGRTAIRGRGIT